MRRFWVSGVLVVALAGICSPASGQVSQEERWGRLTTFVNADGVSGLEAGIRDAIRGVVRERRRVEPRVDELGNLIYTFGSGSPHVLICADMDEDGYFVSAITDDGYLRVHRVTTGVQNRLFEQMHYGQPMFVRTETGKKVPGVFATASTHLQRGRDQATAPPKGLDDLWIDVGARSRSEVEQLGIRMLDAVSLRERSQWLRESGPADHPTVKSDARVAGVNTQRRAAVWALVQLIIGTRQLKQPNVPGTLTVAFTAQGSFGARGMARLAQEISPDRVIVVTRTPMPREGNSPKGAVGQIGSGVLVADNDQKTIDVAREQGLAIQPVPPAALLALNAWPAAKTQVIGLPVLYAQTPVETIDTRDAAALRSLLIAITGQSTPGIIGATAGGVIREAPAGVAGTLSRLISAQGVSGTETFVRDSLINVLPNWAKPETDASGNVTVTFGHGGKELLFVAHLDEIGYAITDIREDGTATVAKRGGFFDYLWEAHPVFVQTSPHGTQFVPAVVAPRPNYLTAATAMPKADEIVLYFGTNSRAETEALGVKKGDTATIRKQLTQLAGSRWTARSMDDRCGVAALVEALKQIDPAKVPNRVTFAFVTGEETGLEGSGFLAKRLHPAYTFAIDTFVSSDSPVDPQRMALVPLGSGVVARAIDNSVITPPDAVARIVAIGKAHQIPVLPSATSGGNDGSRFTPGGSIVMPLSWPGRYSHSPVEVMDLRDLENLVRLIVALTNEGL